MTPAPLWTDRASVPTQRDFMVTADVRFLARFEVDRGRWYYSMAFADGGHIIAGDHPSTDVRATPRELYATCGATIKGAEPDVPA